MTGELGGQCLGGHFEVIDLAVDPPAERRGFAAALAVTLLLGVPHQLWRLRS